MRSWTSLDWRSASTFPMADPDWRRKVWIGGLLLLVPTVGWPVALGYRKALIERLWNGADPLLPEWRGNVGDYWCSGMRAIGVMTVYFAPLYLAFAVRTLQYGAPDVAWAPLLAGLAYLFFLSPFLGPALVVLSSSWMGHDAFSGSEVLVLLAYYAAAVFVLPAGFLQVSRSGRYRSALHLVACLRLIARHPRVYIEAWLYSNLAAMVGHLCVPLSPWGIFWCYQSIVYSFNEILLQTDDPAYEVCRTSDSWYRRFAAGPERQSPRTAFTSGKRAWLSR